MTMTSPDAQARLKAEGDLPITIFAWTAVGDYEHYPQYLNVSRRDGKIVITVRGIEYRDELTPENLDDNWLKPGVLATMTLPDEEAAKLGSSLLSRTPDAQPSSESDEITDDQIKHMVDRFLSWKLPENFNPDNGISFKPTFNDHLPEPMKHNPVGTNLLDAMQAEAMVRHMIAGLSQPSSTEGEVERVARAICWAFAQDTEDCHSACFRAGKCAAIKVDRSFIRDARAAIAAQVTK